MILDRCENALSYLGHSPALDLALCFVREQSPEKLAVGEKKELDGRRAFYSVSEIQLMDKPMRFEYHQKYIDIHLPLTGKEEIALCSAASRPEDTPFDAEKDIGFFDGTPVNTIVVPSGWFCLCMPDDAHVPCRGEEGRSILKAIVKILA